MPRILVYDHLDQPLFELDPNKVYGLKMVEKVNDEHSLTITTSHELEKGQRIFYHDGEKIREFVVLGDVASHADGFSSSRRRSSSVALMRHLPCACGSSSPTLCARLGSV